MPESERKFRLVKCGLLTKSCTQSRAPRTSSPQIITRSRMMMNFSPEAPGPRTMRAVCWNTLKNKVIYFRLKHSQIFKTLVTIHTLDRCWQARKPAWEEQNDRTSPTSEKILIEDCSSCRCFWIKDWYSARQASISLPLIHPRSKSPSYKRLSRRNGAWLSPEMMIAGQKHLNPYPIWKRVATVDGTRYDAMTMHRQTNQLGSDIIIH